MQRHAFLIMAHNNWYVLEKLIQIIDVPWNDIYLHIDRKAKDFDKGFFLTLPKLASIRLTKRYNVTWGNESQITAEMELFKTAYKYGPYHYYHFISGSDLPLLNAQEIYNFFENKNCNFLHIVSDVRSYEDRLMIYRGIFRTKLFPSFLRIRLNAYLEKYQYKIHINRLTRLKKRFPVLGKVHNWCDLTQTAVQKLIEAEKEIIRFTRFTQCSDEMYKQIVLLNQSEDIIGPISKDEIRYIDWSEHGRHPRTLSINDYKLLCDTHYPSPLIFARKFDERVDREIIDIIFKKLMNINNQC